MTSFLNIDVGISRAVEFELSFGLKDFDKKALI